MTEAELLICMANAPTELSEEDDEKLRTRLLEDREFRKAFVALVKKHRTLGDAPPMDQYQKLMDDKS